MISCCQAVEFSNNGKPLKSAGYTLYHNNEIEIKTLVKYHSGWIVPLIIAGVIYFSTCCRTVFIGDSGEFSLVFKILGIAHPPGYPLFALIGRTFLVFTPILKPAFSANLLNVILALCAAPALYVLFDGRKNPAIAGIITLIWLLTPAFWSETSGVEVYTLNLLFIILISVLTLSAISKKWLFTAYLLGLALTHHLTVIALIPSLIYILILERKTLNIRLGAVSAVIFILGLSVYIFLPLRSGMEPSADWGSPDSFHRFVSHITGSQYGYAADFSISNLWNGLKIFTGIVLNSWWWAGAPLIIMGTAVGMRYNRKRALFALMLLTSNLILVSFYAIPDIDPYYLPGLLSCFILAGEGIVWFWRERCGRTARLALFTALCATALFLAVKNYSSIDRSDYRLAEDYGKLILDTAGEGTVFTSGDISSFPALYLRYAESCRPAVEVYDRSARLNALLKTAQNLSGARVDGYNSAREVFFQRAPGVKHLVKSHHIYDEEWLVVPVKLYSHGVLYSSSPPVSAPVIPALDAGGAPQDFKSRQIMLNLKLCRGEEFLNRSPPDSSRAYNSFKQAVLVMEGESRGALHNQLGIFFRHAGYRDLALKSYDNGLNSRRLNEKERAEIIFNISNIYKDMGNDYAAASDFRKAAEAYAEALKFDPLNPRLYFNVGLILFQRLNQPEKGLQYLESYLKMNPGDRQIRAMVDSYKRSR